MVELNFDRARPETILNLNEVADLRGWSRENGSLRLGSGLTYAEAMEAPLADSLMALAEASRTVGSPQIRNRGTLGGNLGTASPAGDALPPLARLWRGGRVRERPGRAGAAARRVPRRAEAERARGRRADPRGAGGAARVAADVHEGGPAERDGDRGRLARPGGGRGAGRGAGVVRVGGPGAGARRGPLAEADGFAGASGRRCVADRRRARDRALPAACAAVLVERALARCRT